MVRKKVNNNPVQQRTITKQMTNKKNLGSTFFENSEGLNDGLRHTLTLSSDFEILQRSLSLSTPIPENHTHKDQFEEKLRSISIGIRNNYEKGRNLSDGTRIGPKVSLSSRNEVAYLKFKEVAKRETTTVDDPFCIRREMVYIAIDEGEKLEVTEN